MTHQTGSYATWKLEVLWLRHVVSEEAIVRALRKIAGGSADTLRPEVLRSNAGFRTQVRIRFDGAVVQMPEPRALAAAAATELEQDVLVDVGEPGARVLVRANGVELVVDLDEDAMDRGEAVPLEESARPLSDARAPIDSRP